MYRLNDQPSVKFLYGYFCISSFFPFKDCLRLSLIKDVHYLYVLRMLLVIVRDRQT